MYVCLSVCLSSFVQSDRLPVSLHRTRAARAKQPMSVSKLRAYPFLDVDPPTGMEQYLLLGAGFVVCSNVSDMQDCLLCLTVNYAHWLLSCTKFMSSQSRIIDL